MAKSRSHPEAHTPDDPHRPLTSNERRTRCLELRKSGMNCPAIARSLGCSVTTVHRDLKAACSMLSKAKLEPEDALFVERVEMALKPISNAVREGEHTAIDRWTRLLSLWQKVILGQRQDAAPLQLTVKVVAAIDLEKL